MKKFSLLIAVAVLAILCSCSSKLEKNIIGVWSGEETTLNIGNIYQATILPTYSFDENGTAQITARIVANKPMTVTRNADGTYTAGGILTNNSSVVAEVVPVAITASVEGKFEIKGDDQVKINLDESTYKFTVTPDAVKLDYLDNSARTGVDEIAIKQQYINEITGELSPDVSIKLMGVSDLSSIKLSDDATVMECVIGGEKVTLRKAPTD